MNRFLKYWRSTGKGEAFQAQVVTYADDFVILSRGHAKQALDWTRQVMTRIGLTLNEAKTSIRQARQEQFDFLGYTFGPYRYRKDGHWYVGTGPSKKSVSRVRQKIGDLLKPSNVQPWEKVRDQLNSHTARLGCVFQPGYEADGVSGRRSPRLHARSVIPDSATQGAVARRRAISGHRSVRIVWSAAVAQRSFVVAVVTSEVKSVGKPDARNGHVRFDERGRETGRRFWRQRSRPASTLPRGGPPQKWNARPESVFFFTRSPAAKPAVHRHPDSRRQAATAPDAHAECAPAPYRWATT